MRVHGENAFGGGLPRDGRRFGGLGLFSEIVLDAPFVLAPEAAAMALMLWVRVTFDRRSFHAVANPTEGGLVTTGPYRFVRHPIYTAVCLFVLPWCCRAWVRCVGFAGYVDLCEPS
jgi:hypothetical protein